MLTISLDKKTLTLKEDGGDELLKKRKRRRKMLLINELDIIFR
jgi:hypothetical protein